MGILFQNVSKNRFFDKEDLVTGVTKDQKRAKI